MTDYTGNFREPTCSHGYGLSTMKNPRFHSDGTRCEDATMKAKTHPVVIALVVAVSAIVLLCIGGIAIAAFSGDDNKAAQSARAVPQVTPDPGVRPTSEVPTVDSTPTLDVKDVTLSVKTTSKKCFGSAGCLVQWEIKAGWPLSKVPDDAECAVTYEVRGLEDTETDTLTIKDNGVFEQNSYTSGSTKRKTDKLSAKVIDVECR